MAVRIAFARIDARDDGETGYSPCAPLIEGNWNRQSARSAEVYRTLALMRREYLTRLYTLQKEIEEKYAPLIPEEELTSDDEMADEVYLSVDDVAIEKEAEALFPGEEAEYYT